ncbi:hypothetical protein GCK32_007138 [Trichostrongylus colubriformis]|uniref:Uncharacterized protein n=1 Tax=Trichostrongylus colubriformis TaxID=6319 RepID=A0AAN8IV98_TRICO
MTVAVSDIVFSDGFNFVTNLEQSISTTLRAAKRLALTGKRPGTCSLDGRCGFLQCHNEEFGGDLGSCAGIVVGTDLVPEDRSLTGG